jgi:hypothetical protein
MKQVLNEGLKYLDMKDQVIPTVSIDQYESTIGDNSEFITVDFTVKDKRCGDDLADWLERGYDFIIDADTSPGEITKRKYLVFAEMSRRSSVPKNIISILADLETLTGLTVEDWQVKINDKFYPADAAVIAQHVALSPHAYREAHSEDEPDEIDSELNEWREIAGLKNPQPRVKDEALLAYQRQAGII